MDERLDKISEQLARVLSILDAKEQKKQVDRDRIKTKREEDAAETAKKRGAIVVDRLTGTFARDDRLPYEKWAYICLEFQSALDFLRWMIHEYLSSYYCLQDGRKRMIARNGNYWKVYKSCGTERLMTPTDMFGGTALKWDDMLEVGVLKWCFKHVMPVMRFCVNDSRLEFVHEHKLAWDDQKVNEECGAPLALEPRWWQKSARFREIMHACVSPLRVRLRAHQPRIAAHRQQSGVPRAARDAPPVQEHLQHPARGPRTGSTSAGSGGSWSAVPRPTSRRAGTSAPRSL